MTGRSVYAPELTSKRMEILKEMIPTLTKVGVLWNKDNTGAAGQLREAETAGRALGIVHRLLPVSIPDGLDAVMARAIQVGAGAILIVSDSSTIGNRAKIGSAALQSRLPTIFANKAYLTGGGLMSYGPDIVESFRLSVIYVDKILKGAKPANFASGTANQIRIRDQYEDGEGARIDCVSRANVACRRSDRIAEKRTWPARNPTPSRELAQIATITCLSLGGDYEATRLHQTGRLSGCVAADSARAACRNAACGRLARGPRK